MPDEWAGPLLSTAQVARVLGVKPQSVYAYASRGRLHPVRVPGRRGSFYTADEVALVRDSGRSPDTGLAERIQTSITLIEDDRLCYRGHDATRLALTESFEQVCGLLWGDGARDFPLASSGADRAAPAAPAELPPGARGIDRIRLGVVVDAAAGRHDAAVAAARSAMAAAVQALAPGLPLSGPLARRLWMALSGKRFDRVKARLLEQALIMLADHELAGSTTTARVAASTRADLHGVLLAALGAFDSPLHGGAPTTVRGLVRSVVADPVAAGREYGRQHRPPPGFGHLVYVESDPRAEFLLRQASAALAGSRRADAVLRSANQLIDLWGEQRGWFPNVDFALAVITEALDLPLDAGETIFAIARMAGWTAHALEEYAEPPMRFRLRAVYVGDRGSDAER